MGFILKLVPRLLLALGAFMGTAQYGQQVQVVAAVIGFALYGFVKKLAGLACLGFGAFQYLSTGGALATPTIVAGAVGVVLLVTRS